MANKVFANNFEVSCKAASGKTIAALPDTCFTPPENPATPPGVPVPYPNTGKASDTTNGSKTVKISKKEVGLKNKSYFKTSYGDEAGCAAKKGIITSKNKGKVYFQKWSSDVKFEGENAVRHFDITTNNHAGSAPGDTPTWPYIDSMSASSDPCAADKAKEEEACKREGAPPYGDQDPCPPDRNYYRSKADDPKAMAQAKKVKKSDCLKARRCKLQRYKDTESGKGGCCPGQTGHHVVPKASFKPKSSFPDYNADEAPCVCVEGASHSVGTHGMMHAAQKYCAITMKRAAERRGGLPTLKQVTVNSAGVLAKVFPESGCDRKCLEAQLDAYHQGEANISSKQGVNPPVTGPKDVQAKAMLKDSVKFVRAIFRKAKAAAGG